MEKDSLKNSSLSTNETSGDNVINVQIKVKDEAQKDEVLKDLLSNLKQDVVAKGYGCVLLDGVVFEIE